MLKLTAREDCNYAKDGVDDVTGCDLRALTHCCDTPRRTGSDA